MNRVGARIGARWPGGGVHRILSPFREKWMPWVRSTSWIVFVAASVMALTVVFFLVDSQWEQQNIQVQQEESLLLLAASLAPALWQYDDQLALAQLQAFQRKVGVERVWLTDADGAPFGVAANTVSKGNSWDVVRALHHMGTPEQPFIGTLFVDFRSNSQWPKLALRALTVFVLLSLVSAVVTWLSYLSALRRARSTSFGAVHQSHTDVHSLQASGAEQIAAGVAHEINNPLQIIAGMTRLINPGATSSTGSLERSERALQKIQTAVQRISQVTGRLMRLSGNGVVGGERASFSPVVAEDLVHQAFSLVADKAEEAQVHVETEWRCKGSIRFFAREVKLVQLIAALLQNAIEACEGTDSRVVKLKIVQKAQHLEFEVRDFGCGVADRVLENLFDPFVTTHEVGEGKGLSLCVGRATASEHGGELRLLSARDPTCFSLTVFAAYDHCVVCLVGPEAVRNSARLRALYSERGGQVVLVKDLSTLVASLSERRRCHPVTGRPVREALVVSAALLVSCDTGEREWLEHFRLAGGVICVAQPASGERESTFPVEVDALMDTPLSSQRLCWTCFRALACVPFEARNQSAPW